MSHHLIFVAALVAGCSLFMFARILERAHRLLRPEQLALLSSRSVSSWSQFLLPLLPVVLGYVLASVFPRYAVWFAVPAIVLTTVLLGLEFRAAAKRTKALGLPAQFHAVHREANAVLLGGTAAAVALVIGSRFLGTSS